VPPFPARQSSREGDAPAPRAGKGVQMFLV